MQSVKKIMSNPHLHILKEGFDGFCGTYTDPVNRKQYFFVFSWSGGWEHLSVSQPSKTPDWDTMCKLKEIFWKDSEACVQYHPRRKDYVNFHKHCLHIWRPIKQKLPIPPSIFVGVKTGSEHE